MGINNKNKDLYIFYRYEASLTSSAAPQQPFLFIFSLKKSNLMADELMGVGTGNKKIKKQKNDSSNQKKKKENTKYVKKDCDNEISILRNEQRGEKSKRKNKR